jgi:hypothetical protein
MIGNHMTKKESHNLANCSISNSTNNQYYAFCPAEWSESSNFQKYQKKNATQKGQL